MYLKILRIWLAWILTQLSIWWDFKTLILFKKIVSFFLLILKVFTIYLIVYNSKPEQHTAKSRLDTLHTTFTRRACYTLILFSISICLVNVKTIQERIQLNGHNGCKVNLKIFLASIKRKISVIRQTISKKFRTWKLECLVNNLGNYQNKQTCPKDGNGHNCKQCYRFNDIFLGNKGRER